MGTDISIFAEKRTPLGWSLCEPLTSERNWFLSDETEDPVKRKLQPAGLFHDRDYDLFAILANVRNDRFMNPPLVPIARPRGVPPDLSPELAEWLKRWGEADDASWLLLREIEEFPWHTMRCESASMVKPSLADLFESSLPFPASRWPQGEPRPHPGNTERDGVVVRWTETYAERIGAWFVVDVMSRLRAYGPPDDVRVVFWFDS